MTLKGKKNHYNVKLLRGYGCSIRLKDNKVVLWSTGKPHSFLLPCIDGYYHVRRYPWKSNTMMVVLMDQTIERKYKEGQQLAGSQNDPR